VVELPFWEKLVTNNHHFAESFVVVMFELSWMSMRFAQQVAAAALPERGLSLFLDLMATPPHLRQYVGGL